MIYLIPSATAIAAVLVIFLVYRRISLSIWGFIASLLVDIPILFMMPLGTGNLLNFSIVTHSIGLVIFPLLLVIADLLLI